jgi:hypothetical protein
VTTSYAIDVDMHGDINITNDSYDIGVDFVTENSDIFVTTGLYRSQIKRYTNLFDSDGLYVGLGKHFDLSDNLSIAANAKIYQEDNFTIPVYCIRLTQRLSLF